MRFSWLAVVVLLWASPAAAEPPDLLPPIWNPTVSESKIRLPTGSGRRRPRRPGSREGQAFAYIVASVLGATGLAAGMAMTIVGERERPASVEEIGAGVALGTLGGAFLVLGLSSLGTPRGRASPTIALGPRSAALRLSF